MIRAVQCRRYTRTYTHCHRMCRSRGDRIPTVERVLSEELDDVDDFQAVMANTSSASAARGGRCETAEVEMRDVANIDLSMFRRCQHARVFTYIRRYRCGDLVRMRTYVGLGVVILCVPMRVCFRARSNLHCTVGAEWVSEPPDRLERREDGVDSTFENALWLHLANVAFSHGIAYCKKARDSKTTTALTSAQE